MATMTRMKALAILQEAASKAQAQQMVLHTARERGKAGKLLLALNIAINAIRALNDTVPTTTTQD